MNQLSGGPRGSTGGRAARGWGSPSRSAGPLGRPARALSHTRLRFVGSSDPGGPSVAAGRAERRDGRPGHRDRGRDTTELLGRARSGARAAARRRRRHRPRAPERRAGAPRGPGHRDARPLRGRAVRLRRVPDPGRRAARRGRRGRVDHDDPCRAGDLRAAAPRLGGEEGRREGARRRAVLRPDGQEAPDRPRPRRRAALRQPRVPRRDPRRGRQHLGDLGCRDEDDVRVVPAVLPLHLGRARQRGDQHQGADLQREGRGPPLPRPRQRPARRPRPGALPRAGAGAARVRLGVDLRTTARR